MVTFDAGQWDYSTSKSFTAPGFKYQVDFDGKMPTGSLSIKPSVGGTVFNWNSQVDLIEAEDAPSLQFTIDPPKIFVDSPGFYASCILMFQASNNKAALSSDDWILEFDFRPWFGSGASIVPIEDESIGSEGHSLVKAFTGKIQRVLDKAKVQCTVNVKDAYIATGFAVSVSFVAHCVVRRINLRPYL